MSSLSWTKLPPDGTNYSYWQAPGGWLISTKKRFLPHVGYQLLRLGSGVELRFDTLAMAKQAAHWPSDQLNQALRLAYQHRVSAMLGTPCHVAALGVLHADALEEDRRRASRAPRHRSPR
jgi:hypothetical protein